MRDPIPRKRRRLFVPAAPSVLLALLITISCGPSLLLDQSHVDEVKALIDDGRYVEAEARAAELLEGSRPGEGDAALARAEVMALHASAWRRADPGKRPEALKEAEKALRLKIELVGNEHPSAAFSWYDLGIFHDLMGEREKARSAFQRALDIGRSVSGPVGAFPALPLIQLAGCAYFNDSDLETAIALLDEARRIQERDLPATHPDVAARLSVLGLIRQLSGDYDEAHGCFISNLEIREQCQRPDHPFIAEAHQRLGSLLSALGDYPGARRHQERALEIDRANHGPDHLFVSYSLMGLANLLEGMGDLDRAEQLYRQALEIQVRHLGDTDSIALHTEQLLAILLRSKGEYEQSEALFAHALEHTTGEDRISVMNRVQLLNRYSSVLFLLDRRKEARTSIRQALDLAEARLGSDHPRTRAVMLNLASFLSIRGEMDSSDALFRRALAGYEEIPGGTLGIRIYGLTEHATVLAALGRQEEALDSALLAQTLARDQLRQTARLLETSLALKYAATCLDGLHTAAAIITDGSTAVSQASTDGVAEAIVRSRALVLDELAARARIVQETSDPEIARRHRELQSASLRLADLTAQGAAADSAAIAGATARKEQAERRLAEASLGHRRRQQSTAGLEQVRSSLPSNSALVAYLRFFDHSLATYGEDSGESDSYLALVLPGRDEPARIIDLGAAREIDRLVLEWREELVKGIAADVPGLGLEDGYRRTGTALREKIWDPVHAEVEGTSRIFLVPDSALHLVSFAALPIGDERYLVEEKAAIHYLSAERELVDRTSGKPMRPAAIDLLLFGNPDFGTLPEGQRARDTAHLRSAGKLPFRYAGLEFSPLPGTAAEVERVAALWKTLGGDPNGETGSPVTFTDDQAAEAAFKEKAPDFHVVHLATHAFFIEPEGGAADASRKPQRFQTGQRAFNLARPDENPLLRAGLALAGANRRGSNGENGILTAEEIVSLDLGRVELAVLSACDTGLGTVQSGEGVFGLRRAFRLAGVDTVINSLWPVEDVSTSQWMQQFYRTRFKNNRTTVEAVRRASLDILERRREAGESSHPFFWAAFVAAGDWR